MTVQELLDMLKGATPTDNVYFRVDCPHGGNSLPIEVNTVNSIDGLGTWLRMLPLDGVEFEVPDTVEEDEDTDDEPDFGQCGKCGQWVHFPCYTCIARQAEQVLAPKVDGEQALSLHLDHVAETRERERLDF